jgi:hypothetical protein
MDRRKVSEHCLVSYGCMGVSGEGDGWNSATPLTK